MPWTMGAFTIGALSMIGLPPTGGFISKWFMVGAAATSDQTFVLAVIVVSTMLNAAYFVPIVYAAFFEAPRSMAAMATCMARRRGPLLRPSRRPPRDGAVLPVARYSVGARQTSGGL